jgi:hypothetical protein
LSVMNRPMNTRPVENVVAGGFKSQAGRGIDSTTQRYDPTVPTAGPKLADSLRNSASDLLARIPKR